MRVRRRVDRDRNEADLAVCDAAFGDDRLRKLADFSSIPTKHRDLEATVVIEMNVHRRDVMAMMLVVRIRQPPRQLAGMVAEDIRQRGDAVSRNAAIDTRAIKAETREVANGFGAVIIPLAFHERGQLGRELVGHADRYPLHGSVLRSREEAYDIFERLAYTRRVTRQAWRRPNLTAWPFCVSFSGAMLQARKPVGIRCGRATVIGSLAESQTRS